MLKSFLYAVLKIYEKTLVIFVTWVYYIFIIPRYFSGRAFGC